MNDVDVIRAWKDVEYRDSLSAEQRTQLIENPAGIVELSDGELDGVSGACTSFWQGCLGGTQSIFSWTCGYTC